MFGIKKPHFPHKISSQHAANLFDSDDELDKKPTLNSTRRTSSKPSAFLQNSRDMLFEDDAAVKGSGYKVGYASKNKYKNDFVDSGGIENQDGEQITRTHMTAADIEQDLSRSERLLGSLGGIFSRTWKPKKGRAITGHEKLGLTTTSTTKGPHHSRTPPPEPTNAMQKVEYEKTKQEDALSDLSNILGELQEMAVNMGSVIDVHKEALNPLDDDVEELNNRLNGANQRTRGLLGK
ncbi:soluble N-ethylmaleimide-sensitive factor adaptor protein 30 [Artemisia annua]|uniref:Soluble N-ethylmaleimide-sensitive factor adaptor protein 30 n=1 Tax=Artemisia annua TaxID=35608 RepID=A0A2U1N284_ARTAN|nr:soluble N-ethylmaleimide-sensitive factor adaptor protein 30 [Artemisia annua]